MPSIKFRREEQRCWRNCGSNRSKYDEPSFHRCSRAALLFLLWGTGRGDRRAAARARRAGYTMTVFDLDADKMKGLIKEGASAAGSPEEVAEHSTMVIASLQPDDVEKVACGEHGIADAKKDGLVFVDLSSTTQELAIKVSESLRARGIEMLDAPLSGADIGATNGHLTIFVGGDYAAYQRCLPVLQHVGRTVTYLGKNGNGQD